ncbi:MAG: Na+/H+ antiporter subunit E [Lachnospiraceae bacterium]|nr:Na+/H+ antiporter subunit E [Lachnospiraceae bacterium]
MYILYFLLWVIFNGQFTAEIAIFGVFIAAALFVFTCKFMDYSIKKELSFYKNIFKEISYGILLVKEVVKANLFVAKLILTQETEPEPMLVTFKSSLKTETARAFLANAITLTPGTITVNLDEDEFTVHCLDRDLAEGIDELEFQSRLSEFEKGGKGK